MTVVQATLNQIKTISCKVCPDEFKNRYNEVNSRLRAGEIPDDEVPSELESVNPDDIQEDYKDSCVICFNDVYIIVSMNNAQNLICADCRARSGSPDPSTPVTFSEIETMSKVDNCGNCASYLFSQNDPCQSEFCGQPHITFEYLQQFSVVFDGDIRLTRNVTTMIENFVNYRNEFYKAKDTGLSIYCVCGQPGFDTYYDKDSLWMPEQPEKFNSEDHSQHQLLGIPAPPPPPI